MVVVLELDKEKSQVSYPFKSNRVWLEDDSFCSLVKAKWKDYSDFLNLPPMIIFLKKLYKLSAEVKSWEKKRKEEAHEALVAIEVEIDLLEDKVEADNFSSFHKDRLVNLHIEREKILLQIEQTWRLKIHVVW